MYNCIKNQQYLGGEFSELSWPRDVSHVTFPASRSVESAGERRGAPCC